MSLLTTSPHYGLDNSGHFPSPQEHPHLLLLLMFKPSHTKSSSAIPPTQLYGKSTQPRLSHQAPKPNPQPGGSRQHNSRPLTRYGLNTNYIPFADTFSGPKHPSIPPHSEDISHPTHSSTSSSSPLCIAVRHQNTTHIFSISDLAPNFNLHDIHSLAHQIWHSTSSFQCISPSP
jgi:hypothetical protein